MDARGPAACLHPAGLLAVMNVTGSIVPAADQPAAPARLYCALLAVEPQPGLSASH